VFKNNVKFGSEFVSPGIFNEILPLDPKVRREVGIPT